MDPAKIWCIKCKKETNTRGIAAHFRIVHLGLNELQIAGNKARSGKKAWNSGLNKTTDNRILKMADSISAATVGKPGHKVSEETKKKISNTCQSNKKSGGYRKGSGIGKSGWYHGIWCDSTWELAYIIWCEANNKKIIRNTEYFDYTFEGKKHRYLPDFIVDGKLVEIKGRRKSDSLIDAKIDSTNGKVKLMLEAEMKPILDSVQHLQPLEKLYGG